VRDSGADRAGEYAVLGEVLRRQFAAGVDGQSPSAIPARS
jgi:hypothetical protein